MKDGRLFFFFVCVFLGGGFFFLCGLVGKQGGWDDLEKGIFPQYAR